MTNVLGKHNVKVEGINEILLKNKNNNTVDEETHSFLPLSSSTGDDGDLHMSTSMDAGPWHRGRKVGGGGGGGAGSCRFASTNIACVGLYLLTTIALICVAVAGLEWYRRNEAEVMRTEIGALRRDVDALRQRMKESDILGEMKAFEDAVYAEEATTDDDDDDDDDGYTDYDVDNPEEMPVASARGAAASSGDHHAKLLNTETPNQIAAEERIAEHKRKSRDKMAARHRREAYGGGLPVVAGSYGVANKTEGLRLYESLVANSQEIVTETTETPIKQYHRVSPLWSPKQHRKKYRQHPTQSFEDDGLLPRHPRPKSTQAPSPIISRPSRVMKTDKDPSRRVSQIPSLVTHAAPPPPQELRQPPPGVVLPPPALSQPKKTHEGEILFRVYQEQRAVPESTIKSVDIADLDRQRRRKPKPLRKNLPSLIEGVEADKQPSPMRHRLLPAAHFIGDTSRYTQAHENYDGNGRLRHPDGVFTDWAPSQWVQQLGMDRHFKYEDGAVNIKDTGLYFVYAQIHYLDEHDINGYRVYVNEDPMMQCTTMTHSMGGDRIKKSNTCFTAAALFLTENDRLSLSDIGGLRYSLFEPTKSFFGLIKLGSVSLK